MPKAGTTSSQLRPMTVAGTFYPADKRHLDPLLRLSWNGAAPAWKAEVKAAVVPHAGLVFSGMIAATALKTIASREAKIERVVLFSPAHRHAFKGIATTGASGFATPLGPLMVDRAAVEQALLQPGIEVIEEAFDREHGIEVLLPLLRKVLPSARLVPFVVGDAPHEALVALIERMWGGPETLVLISSDMSHYLTHEQALEKDAETAGIIERLEPEKLTSAHACGHRALAALLRVAQRKDLRPTRLDLRNSSQTVGDPSRVVGYGAFSFVPALEARLPDSQREALCKVARQAIGMAIRNGSPPQVNVGSYNTPLRTHARTFVTLEENGRLRGCIGSYFPQRALVEDVAVNAAKAAISDPRFKPVTEAEAAKLDLTIAILSTPIRIQAPDEAGVLAALQPDVHGLILQGSGKQAIFLPKVWESLPEPRAFIRALKRKAGLAEDAWPADMRAFRYTVESFKAPPAE